MPISLPLSARLIPAAIQLRSPASALLNPRPKYLVPNLGDHPDLALCDPWLAISELHLSYTPPRRSKNLDI